MPRELHGRPARWRNLCIWPCDKIETDLAKQGSKPYGWKFSEGLFKAFTEFRKTKSQDWRWTCFIVFVFDSSEKATSRATSSDACAFSQRKRKSVACSTSHVADHFNDHHSAEPAPQYWSLCRIGKPLDCILRVYMDSNEVNLARYPIFPWEDIDFLPSPVAACTMYMQKPTNVDV